MLPDDFVFKVDVTGAYTAAFDEMMAILIYAQLTG